MQGPLTKVLEALFELHLSVIIFYRFFLISSVILFLRLIPLLLTVFLATMWKSCQCNKTNSLEICFHMVAKKAAKLNGIDLRSVAG